MQPYIKSKHVRTVQGDALVAADVQRAWDAAGDVDVLLFTLGGVNRSFHPTKGVLIEPHNIVTQAMLNVVCTMPQRLYDTARVVAISSNGLTPEGHAKLPFAMRLVYAYLLPAPHRDKVGLEFVLAHCGGRSYSAEVPGDDIMGPAWKEREGLPPVGAIKRILVVRPAWLTDGECQAESTTKKMYRVSEQEVKGWVISRADVAHFLFEAITKHWGEYEGKCVNVVY
jgi:hypothetical protein